MQNRNANLLRVYLFYGCETTAPSTSAVSESIGWILLALAVICLYNFFELVKSFSMKNDKDKIFNVSELLSKPKPWDKLTEKGHDSYRKMHAWACNDNAVLLLKSLIPKKVCLAGSHEKRLLHHLLDAYNVLERPVVNESDPLQLSFGLTLMQIIDVEDNQWNHQDNQTGYMVFPNYFETQSSTPTTDNVSMIATNSAQQYLYKSIEELFRRRSVLKNN